LNFITEQGLLERLTWMTLKRSLGHGKGIVYCRESCAYTAKPSPVLKAKIKWKWSVPFLTWVLIGMEFVWRKH